MTDPARLRALALAVIEKYGATTDKPSVTLASGVLALLDEIEKLRRRLNDG